MNAATNDMAMNAATNDMAMNAATNVPTFDTLTAQRLCLYWHRIFGNAQGHILHGREGSGRSDPPTNEN